ncbi:hypothetical protein [Clostridium drakei]|uniref:Uncharacterized protein n=1 Tax=Clostridium drakei TaxID=332101 RepID=A0A2U8DVA7_9CLOT|nr:hypothetical protein [Clostridium drakei]AWI06703.1 hypothetical protein B9W14_20125 [Clostridium drakei]
MSKSSLVSFKPEEIFNPKEEFVKNEKILIKEEFIQAGEHPRLNKVTHMSNKKSRWQDIIKKIIINHLKSDKHLD